MKFDVNDPWAVPYQIAVFYGLIPIRGLMRLLTVLHIKTMGETSNIFSEETTEAISFKFDVHTLWVVPS